MLISDTIYGDVHFNQPVLEGIINSQAFQRLKYLHMHGITSTVGKTVEITRYEHTIGVAHLVQLLGGSINEVIMALLHDISHTALSHVFDFVNDNAETQDYHDKLREDYLEQSGLQEVLVKYGYRVDEFIDESRYTLLEQPLPHLCADRVDYFLHESERNNIVSREEIELIANSLIQVDERIAIKDLKLAKKMAEQFIEIDKSIWSDFKQVTLYRLTGILISQLLQQGVLDEKSKWKNDRDLWDIIRANGDPAMIELIESGYRGIELKNEDGDLTITTKKRALDPLVLDGETAVRLSSIDKSFAKTFYDYYRTPFVTYSVELPIKLFQ